MINSRNATGFQDKRSTDQRGFLATHVRCDPDGNVSMVHPARMLNFGSASTVADLETYHPQLTLYSLSGNQALTLLMTVDELEAVAAEMLKSAAKMRADAAKAADAAIDRARS